MSVRTCAFEGCGASFETPHNSSRKYCDQHAGGRPQTEETAATELERQRTELLAHEEMAELKKLAKAEVRRERYLEVLKDALGAYEPTPLLPVPDPEEAPVHEWILVLSDWHVGQQTFAHETGGLFSQSVSRTRRQVENLFEATSRILDIEGAGRRIEKLHVMVLGDIVDGDDMRPSQHRKVEDVVTVQTVQAWDLLGWLLRQLLRRFPEIEVDLVGGNHDRTSQKRGDGGLAELDYVDTFSWIIGEYLIRKFEDEPRISIANHETFFGRKIILGKKFVFEHGASFKAGGGYGGIPWYGVTNLGPKYERMLNGADVVVMGHLHQPALVPNGRNWIVMNGALPPSSTFIQSAFKSIVEPQQWLLSVHERKGITGFIPLKPGGSMTDAWRTKSPHHRAKRVIEEG